MAESNGQKRALVVIDSDDDEAPLAPWVRTVSDQAEVADIIEIKDDEEEDDDELFEKEMNVQYGSSPSRVKKEKKPKPDPSPGGPSGGGGAPQGGTAPGGHGAATPAPAPAAAPPVIGGMPTAAEKTAHLLTLPAGARDLQRLLWHIGITFKLLPHQPVAVRMVAGVGDDYPNLATNASLDGALLNAGRPTNRGGLLADVMGLGKTVEAICGAALRQAICASKNLRPLPVVIVSPNVSVLDQWSEHLSRGGVPPTDVLEYTGRFHDRVRKYNRRCQPAGDGSATWVLLTRHCLMNDVQAAMDAFSKDDEVAQVSPLFPTAEKELLEDLRDQYLAANAKLKGKNTLRQKGEGEHDVVRRLIDDYYHPRQDDPRTRPDEVIRTLIRRSGWDVSAAVERIENGGAEK